MMKLNRRRFLAVGGTGAAGLSLAGRGRVRRLLRGAPAPTEQVAHRGPSRDVFTICDN